VADAGPFPARNGFPCGCFWSACYTHPQAERWAESNLRRAGYKTFLPLVTVRRRDPVSRTIQRTAVVPLFPRYLFVWFDGLWAPIQHNPGVNRLIMREPGKPAMVPEAAISALQAVQALPAPPIPWEAGTPCSLALGAFAGRDAVVLDTHGEHATVAVLLFGALRQVRAPVAWLVARQ
jgi:transcription antitermination factor NusG